MLAVLKHHYDSIFLIVGNAVSRVLMIVSTIIMVKFLGDTIYSKYALLYNGLLGIQVFLTLGLNAVAIKRIASGEYVIFTLIKIIKIIISISCLFFLFFYFFIRNDLVHSLNYFKEINFIVIVFVAISLVVFSIFVSILYGVGDKFKIAKINIINSSLILLLVSFSSFFKNLNLIFFTFGLANTISIIFFILRYREVFYKNNEIENKIENHTKNYVKQGFPVFLSALLVTPIIGVLYTFMNASELGDKISVFSVAMQWYSIILFVPGVLANLLLAEFSKDYNILSLDFYFRQIFINFIITIVVSLVVYFVLLFLLPIYGVVYSNNINVFIIFILAALVNSFNTVAGQLFISINKQLFGFYFNLIWAGLILVLAKLSLNNGYGLQGVAISFLFSYLLHAFNQNLYIYYFFKSSRNG